MTRRIAAVLAVGMMGLALAGCDFERSLVSKPESRTKIMGLIAADRGFATEIADRLIAGDSTRVLVVDRFMANGTAKQDLLLRAARDRTMMDGILALAAQDSVMRDHVVTLVRGMEMAGGR